MATVSRVLIGLVVACIHLPAAVHGHGAMVIPPSRNAVDRVLPEYQNGGFTHGYYGCNCGNQSGVGCNPGTRSNMNGQPCLWFSQGCTIGCETCDNHTQHTMGKSLCNSTMEPTLPKSAWTMNLWVVPGSSNDTYRYHPWRAPGHAPVVDACGMAGGAHQRGGGAAVFAANKFATQGDLGSKTLPKSRSGATWRAGTSVEVAWGIRANHGGGYQYRLCPASSPLTEECFQAHPLPFDRNVQQSLRYTNGSQIFFDGLYVNEGVRPAGSTWARNPVPRIDFDSKSSGQPIGWDACVPGPKAHDTPYPITLACRQFKSPACDDGPGSHPWHPIPGKSFPTGDVEGNCSGDFISASIVDHVVIPRDTPAGEYVLGWRWDCEETAQIWSSCGDITVVA